MLQIKTFLLSLDYLLVIVSGYSFIDIAGTILYGNLALSSIDNFIKLLLSMAGFVYLCVRIYHFVKMSQLNREYRRQEVIEKENQNFDRKFKKEFIEPFNNENK